MTASARLALAAMLPALAGCAELDPVQEGEPGLIEAVVEPMSDSRFAVSLSARNMDGYELARCIAAGHADSLRDGEGARLHDVFRREGGRLTDEFRLVDGVRTQTTTGVQTYVFDPELGIGDHDGRDVMEVDVQLSRCEKAGLPTGAE